MLKIPFLNNSPHVSLSQLQRTYLDSQKRKHQYSSSTNLPKFTHEDIKIKSPFYRKICQKVNCKCEFHKKLKIPIPKFIHGIKRDLINFNKQSLEKQSKINQQNNKNRKSSSLNRNVTLLKSIRQSSQFMKQKRFKTLAQECQYEGIDMNQARRQYEEFIISQKKRNKGSLDCHNIQFQQFLKSRYLCILENFKKPSRKDLHKKNRIKFKKNYLSTQFNNDSQGDEQGDHSRKQGDESLRGTHLSHFRSMSKLNLKNTKSILNNSGFGNNTAKKQEFNQFINKLKEEYFGDQQVSEDKLLALICKNLMAGDQNLKQQTRVFIKRLSQVPLGLFKSLFSDMKQQIKSGINIDLENLNKTEGDVQEAVKQLINQMQTNIEDLIKQKKQKKGQQKISILNKMRKQINSGGLLGNFSSNLSKKTRRSRIITDPLQFQNWDNVEMSEHSLKGQNDSKIDEIDQENDFNSSDRNGLNFHMAKDKSHSTQVRKATKNKKTNQKKIIKQIQNQIEKANQVRKPFKNKTFALPQQIAYEKRRAQSRRRLRQQESQNHRQFIQMMKQKQIQRRSSTLSEYQAHKNTMKSHFQRNKMFLKKMQITLGNSQLKDVVINLQDDVLTKKRKMRLIQNMIQVQQIKETSFYQDMRKYIDIYEKNCMLATKNKNKEKNNNSSRFTKRLLLSREKYFEYQLPELETKKSTQQIQLINMLKLDNQLKFYIVNLIECQGQEDPDNFTIKIPQSISHKQVTKKRFRNVWNRLKGEHDEQEQEWVQSDIKILCQTGFNNKFPQQKIRNRIQQKLQLQLQSQECFYNSKQNKRKGKKFISNSKLDNNILKLQNRFQKKMKEYRRIFKTCGNQNQQPTRVNI